MASAADTIKMVDALLLSGAAIIRTIGGIVQWTGGPKLASELEKVAGQVDAFRSNPVYFQEIEQRRGSHYWDGQGNEFPAPQTGDAEGKGNQG